MSFGGHALEIIKRINANAALKKGHREKFTQKGKQIILKTTDSPLLFTKNDLNEAEIDKIKTEIRQKLKKERRKESIFTIILALSVFLALLLWFLSIKN
ncbi:hypothetical protein [Capnocytophaga sp.]|uniref:hypothetical protein n=1 Tax=Capnocytophaga sp. TaxID=44737 RepID=UPI0026DB1392|nr:hypothetical protein [Capnocytophaga sp.]MDO5106513.1 hypothetical protein [Capnocytophaga sp.]